MSSLLDIPLLNGAVFCLAAAGIWLAGTKLTAIADDIADRFRIGKAIMGFVFLAAVTDLPEVVTTITASSTGNAALALNNLFGGIALQTSLLVIADLAARHAPITYYPRKSTPVLEAALLILLLSFLLAILALGEKPLWGGIGWGTFVLAASYGGAVYLLRQQDATAVWTPIQVPEAHDAVLDGETWVSSFPDLSDLSLVVRFVLISAGILVLGIVLVISAEKLAVQSGLGSSFIGATLVAGSTSLPELSTTIAAVRLKSYSMAISNIFGSNLIVIALLLPADAAYREGPILQSVDNTAYLALIVGMLVTAVYLIGLIVRSPIRVFGMGLDSVVVSIIYLSSLVAFYNWS